MALRDVGDTPDGGARSGRPPRFEILESNDLFLAVAKPARLLTIPDRYDLSQPSLSQMLARRFEPLWVVHRLDRDTSGVVAFARTEDSHRQLSLAFSEGRIVKTYLALVDGRITWKERLVDLPLRADADRRHRTRVDRDRGKPSKTLVRLLEHIGPFSLIEAMPATGRTHQIRVHLAESGHPVLCDDLYGRSDPILLSAFKRKYVEGKRPEKPLLARLALHASSLEFDWPGKGRCRFEAPLPRDLRATLAQLKKHAT